MPVNDLLASARTAENAQDAKMWNEHRAGRSKTTVSEEHGEHRAEGRVIPPIRLGLLPGWTNGLPLSAVQ